MVNLLRPRKSLGNISNRERAFPLPKGSTPGKPQGPGGMEESRWSGENLAPSDGYSGLFASGLGYKVERQGPQMPMSMPVARPAPTPSSAPPPTAFPSTPGGGGRRRRSSVLQSNSNSTSPVKYKARSGAAGADHALDDAIRSLKRLSVATATTGFSPSKQSRWSISSDDTATGTGTGTDASDSQSLPRPSFDSVRSKISLARSRKSEDKDKTRPSVEELMMMDIAFPEVPPLPVPTTPKRLRGLRKLLTPKKKQSQVCTPTPGPVNPYAHPMPLAKVPTTPSSSALPRPPAPGERGLPKKGSFASLRSLAKKGSSTTLRSLFSTNGNGIGGTDEPIPCPPLPYPPTTPSRHFPSAGARPAKSSIGPPQTQPATSPSKFLQEMPRRAPLTPKKDDHDHDLSNGSGFDTPEMSFSTSLSTPTTAGKGTPMVFTPSFVLSDFPPPHAGGTPSTTTPLSLTAKAQKGRAGGRQQFAHLLPRQARYNHGLETPPPPPAPAPVAPHTPARTLRGLAPGTPGTPGRYNPEYAIISSYSRPSMGPSAVHAKGIKPKVKDKVPDLPVPAPRKQKETEAEGYLARGHDFGTFGQRSVDFTASPAFPPSTDQHQDSARQGDKRTSVASVMSLDASSDGVSAEWELEAYLKEVEAREQRRANFI